jgi:hypothetical protein
MAQTTAHFTAQSKAQTARRKYGFFGGLIFAAAATLCACGGDGGDDEIITDGETPQPTPNPIASSTQFFGQGGNLWKPRGDPHGGSPGNLVVLLSSQFTKAFDTCEVKLNTGEIAQLICIDDQPWTQTPFSCFTNGNRQTWRAPFGCSSAGEVKVTCRDPNQEVIFTVPDANLGSVCQRFG